MEKSNKNLKGKGESSSESSGDESERGRERRLREERQKKLSVTKGRDSKSRSDDESGKVMGKVVGETRGNKEAGVGSDFAADRERIVQSPVFESRSVSSKSSLKRSIVDDGVEGNSHGKNKDIGQKCARDVEEKGKKDRQGLEARRFIEKVKQIQSSVSGLIHREDSKVGKSVASKILGKCFDYEELILELLSENYRLSGIIEEKDKRIAEKDKRIKEMFGNEMRVVENVNRGINMDRADDEDRQRTVGVSVEEMKEKGVSRTFAMIVKGKKGCSGDKVKEKLFAVGKDMDVRVRNVRTTKDGAVLVEMVGREDCRKLEENTKLKECGLKVEPPKEFNPQLIIYDVPNEIGDDELMDEIYRRNLRNVLDADEFERKARIRMRSGRNANGNGNGKGNVVLELGKEIYRMVIKERRICVGWASYKINAYEKIPRCFGCYAFGHRVAECKLGKVCARCGNEGHLMKDCAAEVCCRNCKEKGLPTNHMVKSEECPEYVWRLERWRSRIKES